MFVKEIVMVFHGQSPIDIGPILEISINQCSSEVSKGSVFLLQNKTFSWAGVIRNPSTLLLMLYFVPSETTKIKK